MTRKRSLIRKTGLVAIISLTILAVTLGCYVFVSHRRYQAKLSMMKANGGFLTINDIANEKVPDSENAALVYNRLFKILAQKGVKADVDTLWMSNHDPASYQTPALKQKVRLAASRCSSLIPLVETATSRPRCRFPVKWRDIGNAFFGHFEPLGYLSEILYANATIRSQDNKIDEAVHLMSLKLRLSKALENEPAMISHFKMVSIIRGSSRLLQNTVLIVDLNEKQARTLYDDLSSLDLQHSYVRALQGERAIGMWYFSEAWKNPSSVAKWHNEFTCSFCWDKWESAFVTCTWRSIAFTDQSIYLDTMNKCLSNAHLSHREITARNLHIKEETLPKEAVLTKIIGPADSDYDLIRDEGLTCVYGSQIFLALLAYHDRYGFYPSNLNELRSKLGWKLSKDPFSGKDFIYKQKNKGFLLYSLGLNMKDDGGITTPNDPKEGDMVWKMER